MSNSSHLRRRSARIYSEKNKSVYEEIPIFSEEQIKCPICFALFYTKDDFRRHYEKEIVSFLSGAPDRRKPAIRHDRQKPTMTITQRNNALKLVKRRKYERFSNLYLQSFKSKNPPHTSNSISSIATSENQDSGYELIPCAICDEYIELQNTDNKSISHLAKCFSKRNTDYNLYSSSEDEEEGDENTEEFSWAGQTWIRTSSLLGDAVYSQEGNLTRLQMADGDEILDVDGDETDSYGSQQFTEADVVPCTTPSKSNKLNEKLRQAVCSTNAQTDNEKPSNCTDAVIKDIDFDNIWETCEGDKDKFIKTVKENVEEKFEKELPKCTICMGPYNQPVVSTNCWHVCCSDCWLRALGAKKLCPKCNQIVSPSHLRKIYL